MVKKLLEERDINLLQDSINKMAKEYCSMFATIDENNVWDLVDFVKSCEDALNILEKIISEY